MHRDREGAVRAVLTALAEEIAQAAPRGWKRAELHGYAVGQGGTGHRGFSFEPKGLYGSKDIDVHSGLNAVHTAMEAVEHLTIDLELESRGRYRAVLSERLDRAEDRGFRYLLDKASEPPEPAALQAGSDATEAGDPDEAVALLGEFQRRLGELLESPVELPPPLPHWERQELAEDLGVALPQDLSALYAVVDGDGGRGLLHGFGWFGLEMLAEFCGPEERWWVTRGWRRYVYCSYVDEFGPPATIRRVKDHPAWIPFATDTFGDYLAVDMAPGPRGRPGQVILIGRHQDEGPIYVAESVTELLRRHVDALASDRVKRDEDDEGLWINAGDVHHHKRGYDETCTLKVTGRDAAPVRGMRPETRELTVHNAPWIDLGPVRGAPVLRKFSVSNCAGLDLSPLLEAPVEVVDLGTDTIDLSGLQGHPTVSRVVLHSAKPVDLRPLTFCPHL